MPLEVGTMFRCFRILQRLPSPTTLPWPPGSVLFSVPHRPRPNTFMHPYQPAAHFMGHAVPAFDLPNTQVSSAISVLEGQARAIASELSEMRLLMAQHPDSPNFFQAYRELLSRNAEISQAMKECALSSNRASEHLQTEHTNRTYSNNAVTTAWHHENANVAMNAAHYNHQSQVVLDNNLHATRRQYDTYQHQFCQRVFETPALATALLQHSRN